MLLSPGFSRRTLYILYLKPTRQACDVDSLQRAILEENTHAGMTSRVGKFSFCWWRWGLLVEGGVLKDAKRLLKTKKMALCRRYAVRFSKRRNCNSFVSTTPWMVAVARGFRPHLAAMLPHQPRVMGTMPTD